MSEASHQVSKYVNLLFARVDQLEERSSENGQVHSRMSTRLDSLEVNDPARPETIRRLDEMRIQIATLKRQSALNDERDRIAHSNLSERLEALEMPSAPPPGAAAIATAEAIYEARDSVGWTYLHVTIPNLAAIIEEHMGAGNSKLLKAINGALSALQSNNSVDAMEILATALYEAKCK